MMDPQSLILKMNLTTDSPVSFIGENPKSEELGDDLKDETAIPDPNSFVLLMTQVVSNIQQEQENNMSSNSATQNLENAVEMPVLKGLSQAIIESNQQSVDTAKTNIALAWIDSENYQPQLAVLDSQASEWGQFPSDLLTDEQKEQFFLPVSADEEGMDKPFWQEPINNLSESSELVGDIVSATDHSKNNPVNNLLENSSFNSLDNKFQYNLQQTLTSGSLLDDRNTSEIKSPSDKTLDGNLQNNLQPNPLIHHENSKLQDTHSFKSLEIPVELSNSKWAKQFSEHIVWLGHQRIKSALIKIHPEDLGPIEVNIKVIKDSASVSINSHSSHVRDIVDQALPKLRDMLNEQGLNLSEVHIGSDTNSRQFSQQENASEQQAIVSGEEEVQLTPLHKRPHRGLIDYFA